MSINCESCGYRDNGVKTGAAIFEKGKRITLRMEDREDLSRDILKSETCGLTIPEIDPALQPGTLGGRFIAVESILEQVYEELSEKVHAVGDSSMMVVEDRQKFQRFLKQLKEVTNAEKPFALILDDPLMNSYLQNLYVPDPDPNMEVVTYERTWQQKRGVRTEQHEGGELYCRQYKRSEGREVNRGSRIQSGQTIFVAILNRHVGTTNPTLSTHRRRLYSFHVPAVFAVAEVLTTRRCTAGVTDLSRTH